MTEQNTTNEIMANVASNLIESSLKAAWNKAKKFFKDLDAKDQIKYGDAYEEYLVNTEAKYSKIKTLIYRHVPKPLYSFYECLGVRYDGQVVDTSKVTNLFDISSRIIITGTGGIGKTIMLKHFFLNTLEVTDYIPVMLELRSFNSSMDKSLSIRNAISNVLQQNGFEMEDTYFEYSLKEGGYVFLLDGFDEINRDKTNTLARGILEFSSRYPQNKYILTSRPSDFFIGWSNYCEMSACSLTKEQALALIKKIDFDETTKAKFYTDLENSLFDKYKSFASNPLLLNIMLLTFDKNAAIPDKLNDFYEQAFSTLFNMHDATKDTYVRDIRTGLGSEDFKTVFSYICLKSYFADEFEFTESSLIELIQAAKTKFDSLRFNADDFLEDLTTSVCMIVKEGLIYRFAHRSFQEYFAAWYTCKLTDDLQNRLITNWMRESDNAVQDSYLPMLFSMQADKVNTIIFAPVLKSIKNDLNKEGFSIAFLNKLCQGVNVQRSIREDEEGKKARYYDLSLKIKDRLKCNVLKMTCKCNNYSYPSLAEESIQKVGMDLYNNREHRSHFFTFEEAILIVGETALLDALAWFNNHIQFSLDVLSSVEKSKIRNKRKVTSILNEI